jgi:hypothetical protein
MFVGKEGADPIEEPFKCSTLGYAPGLVHKQKSRLERLTRGEHSSSLQEFVTYGRKKYITLAPVLGVDFNNAYP